MLKNPSGKLSFKLKTSALEEAKSKVIQLQGSRENEAKDGEEINNMTNMNTETSASKKAGSSKIVAGGENI